MRIVNRVVLAILGGCLLAAGVLGALVASGAVESGSVDRIVPFRRTWDRWTDITWTDGPLWIVLAAALALTVLAAILALRQLVPGAPGDADDLVLQRGERGRTVVRGRALRRGLRREAELVGGVRRARVDAIRPADGGPDVHYRLDVDGTRAVRDVGGEVNARGRERLRVMLGLPAPRAATTIRVDRGSRPDRNRREVG
jgi:hypothetical protein